MKKFYIILIVMIIVNGASAQSCLPEGITFTTQAQIDSFQTNYPGCTEIQGDVTIGGNIGGSNITNLNGLSVLTSIGGNLRIGYGYNGNPFLTSLTGLNNLTVAEATVQQDHGIAGAVACVPDARAIVVDKALFGRCRRRWCALSIEQFKVVIDQHDPSPRRTRRAALHVIRPGRATSPRDLG